MEDLNEALNQEQTTAVEDDGSDFFFDAPEETTEETSEPAEVEDVETVEETSEPVEPTEKPFSLKVRFNQEDRELTENEARELAQKGMNYDRIYEPLERLARLNNMQVGEFLNSLNDIQFEAEVSKEMDALSQKYPDTSEEVLRQLAEKTVNETINRKDTEFTASRQEQANAQSDEIHRQVEMFRQEYPNVDTEHIDKAVFDYVRQGYTLLEAYHKWERKEAERNRPVEEQKAKISRMNEANKVKSIGNTTNAEEASGEDAFFDGLNSI